MSRFRRTRRLPAARPAWVAALALSALVAPPARADDAAEPIDLTITPQAEPVPALRYRLIPSAAELTPGNAVPVYLRFFRFFTEQNPEAKRQIHEKPTAWLAEPFDAFPADEAADFVGMFSGRLGQLVIAARRDACDWAYPLIEQREEAHNILLPDVQELRTASRLLAVKARVEIAGGDFDEAVGTIQTGLAMARHLAESPFMISRLVGIAVADQFLDRVEELISRPGAPNLSWALAALPRPLIDLREALEIDQVVGEWILPELTLLDEPRTEAEWEARLARLHGRLVRLQAEISRDFGLESPGPIPEDVAAFRSRSEAAARAHFEAQGRDLPGSGAEAIVRFLAEENRRVLDEALKSAYLPIDEALPLYAREAEPDTDRSIYIFLSPLNRPGEIAASLRQSRLTQARLDRRVAALRVVEAIRWHASTNGGTLPATLDAIGVVPVPRDPITGGAFSYRLDGESALLHAPEATVPVPPPGVSYRLTVRE